MVLKALQRSNTDPILHRIHDLKSVHRNLNTMIELLKSGYVFEQQEKTVVITQLEKSLQILQNEIQLLES